MFKFADIFLNDATFFFARVVKFLMKYPTLWHFLFGKIWGWKPDEVRYYHAGLIIDDRYVVEQQWRVRVAGINQVTEKKSIVWRRPEPLTRYEESAIMNELMSIGERQVYDWLHILGKFLTWLTGIKYFERHVQFPSREICCTLVARCYAAIGIDFGKSNWTEVSTDDIDDYCEAQKWIKVYEGHK